MEVENANFGQVFFWSLQRNLGSEGEVLPSLKFDLHMVPFRLQVAVRDDAAVPEH